MFNNEKVSIIITTYKGSNCIRRAIRSLLEQTYANIEIIVVDDNPPESVERIETEKIMKEYKESNIKYIKHETNLNGAAARNSGIKVATGEFVGFLDDDDYYLPTKVEMCVKTLTENKNSDAVFCGVIATDNTHILRVVKPKIDDSNMQKELLFNVNMMGTGSNLFLRKLSIDKIGYFDVSYYRLQDVEFMVRFFEHYKVCCLDELLIVKAVGGYNNIPQYHRLFNIKQKFYKDFAFALSKLSKDELNKYYTNEYAMLLQSCFGKESVKTLLKAKQDLEKYRHLTIKEIGFILLSILGKPNNNLYTLTRSLISIIAKPIRSIILKNKYKIKDGIIK
ncbi:glycosyltransferase family 2 protein [uncultured Metabacillus sp.]|uniref:glycosyltransferase family 2 protein n=1 Tax=uncultured Metabacillus sp. TaxID=2860135 RepID=UPI002639779E|nr:glycosyltransferase family 2 protein [uncultured Metabacillus sp.]